MDIMNLFESYCDYVDTSRSLIEPNEWSCDAPGTLEELNEWFAVFNEGVVTREEMRTLEMKYRELHKEDLKGGIDLWR